MRRLLFISLMTCLLVSVTGLANGQQGGQGVDIPQSFWGMTVSQFCDMSGASPCTNVPAFGFPGMPFNGARTLGTGITWNTLELCDPTGNWCPLPGSGCASSYTQTGSGAEGGTGTYNHYTNINLVSVTCLRPNGVDGNAATVCLSGILCIASGGGTFPCIPNLKSATDPTNCAYSWNFSTPNGQTDQFDQFVGEYSARGLGAQGPNVALVLNLSVTPDFLSIVGSRCTGFHTAL